MKTLNFTYFACFGKCDYSDLMENCVDIPDDRWDAIKLFHEDHPEECALNQDEFKDVYQMCYEVVLETEAENLLSFEPEMLLDYLEEENEVFDRDDYELTIEDAKEYLDSCVPFTILEKTEE